MKIIYITNARIPTEKAHGLQIMKMCEAFAGENNANYSAKVANKMNVELVVPRRRNSISEGPFEYYGVRKNFKIKKIFCVDLFPLKFIPPRISFFLQSVSFSKLAIIFAVLKHGRKGNIFYSRDYITQFFLCLFGFNPVSEIHDYRSPRPRWLFQVIAEKSRKIITNSEGTKGFLQAHYGISDNKFLVAPNGVDAEFFNIKETQEEAREILGMPASGLVAGYVGRLETVGMEKGINYMIDAFKILSREREDLSFYIIGGPDYLVKIYKERLKELGIEEGRFVFIGQAPYKKIPLYLRAMDIAVIPFPNTRQFANTCSPIKIFEFLAAGKPVIASDLPSIKGILPENICLYFKPENPEELAQKISFLAENRELIKKMSQNALQKAQEHTWQKRAEKILQCISLASNI